MADKNIGTPQAPLYVPEESAGYQNYLQNIKTPSVDSLQTQTPINVNSTIPPNTVDTAGTMVASVPTVSKSIQDYITELTPPKTETQQKAEGLTEDISSLLEKTAGRTQSQQEAEVSAGVPELKKQLADLNAQILSKNASYEATNTAVEGQAIPMSLIIGQQAQVRKAQASEIGMLQARALGLQGRVQFAQDTANKAVDLKYSYDEDQLKIKKAQLELILPSLSKEEQITANALSRKYADEKAKIDAQKTLEKENVKLALDIKADPETFDQIQKAKTSQEASRIASEFNQKQSNLQDIKNASITSPYVNKNGEVQDSKTGYAFKDPQDFKNRTGMTLDEAQQRGLISSLKLLNEAKNTEIVTIGGRKLLINSLTGETIKNLGSSGSGDGDGEITVTSASEEVRNTWKDQKYIQGNGKISSKDYKKTKAWWIQQGQGLSASSFDLQFSDLIDQSGKNWKVDYGYKGN